MLIGLPDNISGSIRKLGSLALATFGSFRGVFGSRLETLRR